MTFELKPACEQPRVRFAGLFLVVAMASVADDTSLSGVRQTGQARQTGSARLETGLSRQQT